MPLLRHFVTDNPIYVSTRAFFFLTDPRLDGVYTPYTFTSTHQSPAATYKSPRAQQPPTRFYSHVVNCDPPVVSHKPLLRRRLHQTKTLPAGLILLHATSTISTQASSLACQRPARLHAIPPHSH